jgi:hypothetical protein
LLGGDLTVVSAFFQHWEVVVSAGDFAGEFGPLFFQRFLELLRCSWERQRFLWRGFIWWIFGGGALASRFLGFVRRVEYS